MGKVGALRSTAHVDTLARGTGRPQRFCANQDRLIARYFEVDAVDSLNKPVGQIMVRNRFSGYAVNARMGVCFWDWRWWRSQRVYAQQYGTSSSVATA